MKSLSCVRYSSGTRPLAFGGTLRIRDAPWPYLSVNCDQRSAAVMKGMPGFQNQLPCSNTPRSVG